MTTIHRLAAGGITTACVAAGVVPAAAAAPQVAAPQVGAARGAAAVHATRAVQYRGRTREGDTITFSLRGSRISNVAGWLPGLCLPTEGQPLSGKDSFNPPGSFVLGHKGKAKAKRPNYIYNSSDVTKNFTLATKRQGGGRITGAAHDDYSFLMILPTYPISARPYVCTGDTTFQAAPAR